MLFYLQYLVLLSTHFIFYFHEKKFFHIILHKLDKLLSFLHYEKKICSRRKFTSMDIHNYIFVRSKNSDIRIIYFKIINKSKRLEVPCTVGCYAKKLILIVFIDTTAISSLCLCSKLVLMFMNCITAIKSCEKYSFKNNASFLKENIV